MSPDLPERVAGESLGLPATLSPSRMATFIECPARYRFQVVDRIVEPPSVATAAGTLAHAALERLLGLPAEDRSVKPLRRQALDEAVAEWESNPNGEDRSELDAGEVVARATAAYRRYFSLEDPASVTAEGIELDFTVDLGPVLLRGIIDRLDRTEDGLVVVDYKTGRAPNPRYLASRMLGVRFYALMVYLDTGEAPTEVGLMYLGDPGGFFCERSTERTVERTREKVLSVWAGIESAFRDDVFHPRPSRLCDWCAYRPSCPAFNPT